MYALIPTSDAQAEIAIGYNPEEREISLSIVEGEEYRTVTLSDEQAVKLAYAIYLFLGFNSGRSNDPMFNYVPSNDPNYYDPELDELAQMERAARLEYAFDQHSVTFFDEPSGYEKNTKQGVIKAHVFISLPQEEIDLLVIERIQEATNAFMEAMGFKLEAEEKPVFGSFFQSILYFFTGRGRREANEAFEKGKQALTIKYIDSPSAEATHNLAVAAAALITSLNGVSEGAVRAGGILVVKITQNGVPRILAETVSPAMAHMLDENLIILENPTAVFGMIASMQSTSKRIQQGGTARITETE